MPDHAAPTNSPISRDFITLDPGLHTVRVRALIERRKEPWGAIHGEGRVTPRAYDRVTYRDGFRISTRLGEAHRDTVWIEGRASDFIGTRGDLAPSSALGELAPAVTAIARRWNVAIREQTVTLARFDVAVDVRFRESAIGLAFLESVAGLNMPRCQAQPIRATGSPAVETAQWRNKQGVVLRIYDVTARRGPNPFLPRTRRVRFERQVRISHAKQVPPHEIESHDLAQPFLSAIRLWLSEDAIPVREFPAAYLLIKRRLGQAFLDGSGVPLNETTARYLVGAAADLLYEGLAAWRDPNVARDFDRRLRRHGIDVQSTPWEFSPMDVLAEVATAVAVGL